MKILSVVGARPNFMKIAPIAHAIKKHKGLKHIIVHTGQHYDHAMSGSFFKDLGIPRPDINLEVGSASHAKQTGLIMMKFEDVLLKYQPNVVLVVGDVNSTAACSIVASKLGIAVVHVEAGLRSLDRNMPEEINRLVTDSISDVLFTTSQDADKNLIKEGVPKDRIFFVGNVMIDTLMNNIKRAERSNILNKLKLKKNNYALMTLHRPSNVDSRETLRSILEAVENIQSRIKIVFPIHPRTRKNIERFFPTSWLKKLNNLLLVEPQGYLDFLSLMKNAKFLVTDSGGIQEETTALGIPCLTVRKNTERPITITEGTNTLVGLDKNKIIKESLKILNGKGKHGRRPKYWEGKASDRIVSTLMALHKKNKLRR
jgi:UDP-N-acetylglucosamine 2-epimerase (non-hydrolysing)